MFAQLFPVLARTRLESRSVFFGPEIFWPKNPKMSNFYPKIWIFGAESQFFCFGIGIFVNRAYLQYARDYNFPIGTTQKISVSELWVIFWGSPLILAVPGLCHFISISTLNFGPSSTKLGGTIRAIKKMTQNDNGLNNFFRSWPEHGFH